MKYKDPITGELKSITVKSGDTLPIGTIVEFDGTEIPDGYEEVTYEETGSMGSIIVDDITCKNIFDKNNVYINKALNDSDGTIFEATNRNTTDFIVVKPNSDYIFSNISRTAVCLYDNNKTFIKTLTNNLIATTSNTYYLRFTYKTDEDYSKGQLELGSVATDYVEHKEFSNKQIYSTEEKVIGTWMGKPLYRKTIGIRTPNTTNNTEVYSFDTNFIIKNYYGFVTISESSQLLPINFYFTNEYNVATYITKNTGKINMKVGSIAYTNQLATISLEYTKTTD